MGILDKYKEAIQNEEAMPKTTHPDADVQAAIDKMTNGQFTEEEIAEAIANSKRNMAEIGDDYEEEQRKDINEYAEEMKRTVERVTEESLIENNNLVAEEVAQTKIIHAFCPYCGKEIVSNMPPMFNQFTMERLYIHRCCGHTFNLDCIYPRVAYFNKEGKEIKMPQI